MGTRTRISAPPAPVGLRDYRTMTLPAVDQPGRVDPFSEWDTDLDSAYEMEADNSFERGRPFDVTRDRGRGNARSEFEHLDLPSRPTRTVMTAARRGKHDTGLLPNRSDGPSRRRDHGSAQDVLVIRAGSGRTAGALAPRRDAGDPAEHAPLERRPLRRALADHVVGQTKRRPKMLLVNLALMAVVGLAVLVPHLTTVDAAAGCSWHTVVRNDTLGNLGYANHTTAMTIAQANHIANPNLIYVGQVLCIPVATWGQAPTAPATGSGAVLAAVAPATPPAPITGSSIPVNALPAGEPCTADRSIVWTVPVSRWAIPPSCFGGIYSPNPNDFLVNGQVIPAFGWCNWWPEALLRNPHAIDLPHHSTPRPGVAVYWAPQAGETYGHYGFVESIGTGVNAGWILISEMNMYWRGGGFAKVDYRYIAVDYPGANYLYN